MPDTGTPRRASIDLNRVCWMLAAICGVVIHVGTAVLRLDTFIPYPHQRDFAGAYTAAWAIRRDIPLYQPWSPTLLQTLKVERGLEVEPTPFLTPPLLPWLMQPFLLLSFPTAAWVWFLLVTLLLTWSAWVMAEIAGCTTRGERAAVWATTLTFGPTVLSLTLGQLSPILLSAALMLGMVVRRRRDQGWLPATVLWVLSVAAKLFPAAWVGALLLLRRWRLCGILVGVAALTVLPLLVLTPGTVQRYAWLIPRVSANFLVNRLSVDDQALVAWVERVGRPQRFSVSGLSTATPQRVVWSPPWSIDPRMLRVAGYTVVVVIGIALTVLLIVRGVREPEGALYLWVLFTVLSFPHMERYNHVLLLPAMAWLWQRPARGRTIALAAYLLTGLSRLNHLWVLALPAPWGPLASGFGVCAVILLGYGIVECLWSVPAINPPEAVRVRSPA